MTEAKDVNVQLREQVDEQNAKLQQQEAAPKRAEKTRMAAPKCATQKKFRPLCSRKSINI